MRCYGEFVLTLIIYCSTNEHQWRDIEHLNHANDAL